MDCDEICPKCKTSKYRNPCLKLMVNVCGHNLCSSCVDLLFVKGSGNCPECGISLRKSTFRVQLFSDAQVDKEIDLRKRLLRDFNSLPSDFPDLKSYNDYLEQVEDIIFNLSHNIDILETNKKIATYKEKNRDKIQKNKSKMSYENMEILEILHQESQTSKINTLKEREREKEEEKAKAKAKEDLIDELMFNEDKDPNDICNSFKKPVFSTGISSSLPNITDERPKVHYVDTPYVYAAESMDFMGPDPPITEDDVSEYRKNIRAANEAERAGGYVETIACLRAIQDAMSGLYFSGETDIIMMME